MDDDILQRLQADDSTADSTNSQSRNDAEHQDSSNTAAQEQSPTASFAFITAAEAGIQPQDPNDIPAAPRPQPGMTFTPTGGSVSKFTHLPDNTAEIVEPDEQPPVAT